MIKTLVIFLRGIWFLLFGKDKIKVRVSSGWNIYERVKIYGSKKLSYRFLRHIPERRVRANA